MTEDDTLHRTQAVIERVVGANRTPAGHGPDVPLTDGYWLDSVEMLEVIVACESEFGITFSDADSDLGAGAFATLSTLTALIRRKRAGLPPGP